MFGTDYRDKLLDDLRAENARLQDQLEALQNKLIAMVDVRAAALIQGPRPARPKVERIPDTLNVTGLDEIARYKSPTALEEAFNKGD